MYRNDVLVVEISGKRPGTEKNRPTEYMDVEFDHLIISNNSDGYETKWEIVNVPESYRSWYIENVKNSENAWYAPMNRSYAIKYAREKGYKYLVQLDDNIKSIRIAYSFKNSGKKYDCTKTSKKSGKMINDIIDMLVTVLENTNAGMSGCNMMGAGMPGSNYLAERYCYSLFALDLSVVPDCFHGDFEDDVEYRIRLSEMGIPCVQVCCLLYGKTAQGGTKDLSGCRKAYHEAGILRGEHMRKIHGDVYSAGISSQGNRAGEYKNNGEKYFRHKLKPIKIGVQIKNKKAIDDKMKYLLKKYASPQLDKCTIKEKRCKNGKASKGN